MKIVNIYNDFIEKYKLLRSIPEVLNSEKKYSPLLNVATEWDLEYGNIQNWMNSPEYEQSSRVAQHFISKAEGVVLRVESAFGVNLPGTLLLCPSMMHFDGFARFDEGKHTVLFGVDHPDAGEEYLNVLLAHELSHVYRDHQPEVWNFLGKPLSDIKRKEYLENITAAEHLASEGLATLFSQIVFPEVPLHIHHYYLENEMLWCFQNHEIIEKAIMYTLDTDKNIWKFYEEDAAKLGSPARVHYFWAAQRIKKILANDAGYADNIIKMHGKRAEDLNCF